MKEIYCAAGKMIVHLPEDAWKEFGPGIPISPCEGCQHVYHLKQLDKIKKDLADAELVRLRAVAIFSHNVNVSVESETPEWNNAVLCTCNCTVHFSDYK